MLKSIIKRAKEQMAISLDVTTQAKELLVEKGYDEKYGARPLRRTIQNLLEDKLAEAVLDGSVKVGDEVEVIPEGEGLGFSAAASVCKS